MAPKGKKWVIGVSTFTGENNHTIDAKGRLIIPAKYREVLGDTFYVTKGLDGCLFVYDNTEWANFEEKLNSLPLTSKDARKFVRFFLAGAVMAEVDKQGRILLPASLRKYAELEKDVVLAGVGKRIEIWNKEKWEAISNYDEDDMDQAAEHMEDLGIRL